MQFVNITGGFCSLYVYVDLGMYVISTIRMKKELIHVELTRLELVRYIFDSN